jgi:hypothetical protein
VLRRAPLRITQTVAGPAPAEGAGPSVASTVAAVRARIRTIGFVTRLLPMFPSQPIDWVTRAPVIESVTYKTRGAEVKAELYRPRGRGPYPAVLLAAAYDYLLRRADVNPASSGLYGACVGGSFALLAAADPSIRDRVAFVGAFAPYS